MRPPARRTSHVARRTLLSLLAGGALAAACSRSKPQPGEVVEVQRRARPGGAGPAGPLKRGGVLRNRLRNDYVNLDPHATAQASAQWVGMLALSRLLRFAIGPGEDNLAPRVVPEVAVAVP